MMITATIHRYNKRILNHYKTIITTTTSSSSSSSSSTKNNTSLWAMASALVFVPTFIYFTKPPDDYSKLNPTTPHVPTNTILNQLNPQPTAFKYVLLGGGTAAYYAMQEIRKHDLIGEILMITSEEFVPYERPPLSKELWHNATQPSLANQFTFINFEGQSTSIFYDPKSAYDMVHNHSDLNPTGTGTKLLTKTIATSMDLDKHTITLSTGKSIQYEKLLLATGARPKTLPSQSTLPQAVQNRVGTYRTLADFQKLMHVVHTVINKKEKSICVIGGGFLGSELALALASQPNVKVTQVFPEDGNMGKIFPKYLTRYTTSLMQSEGVTVLTNSLVTDLHYDDNTDQIHVHLNNNNSNTKGFDHVVVAIGVDPNIELALNAGLEIDPKSNGILVNAELEARRDVFCAGDNVSFYDLVLGRRRVEHYDNAVSQGQWAGQSMAIGAGKPFTHLSMFWSDLGPNLGYEAVGELDGTLVTVSVWGVNDIKKQTPVNHQDASVLGDGDSVAELSPQYDEPINPTLKSTDTVPTVTPTLKPTDTIRTPDLPLRKGVVFYVRDQRIVGVLMMNVRGQADIARAIIKDKANPSQAKELAARFDIFGANSSSQSISG